eukprot:CAMPEP_0119473200 /NCGR_PEP_ID=MMETSP1344-20130328/4942_1 /TAXON_ID=236787 /ORGANISM="Florenciella parvula, Strain CCMP2471" /LENGTH=2127 /DNA_ID=CAMNT_0007506261 /DNA_START=134 /DNA_END=6517 /DNA_ORIENTATION=-
MTSNGWLLVQLLEQLPWPAGTTSKLFTLAQCRCPTAQLLVNVETAGDMGGLQLSARRRSSFALGGCVVASPADVDVQNKRRSDILLVWQKLWATGSDAGWLEVITSAHQGRLDLDFPTPEGETILYKAAGYRHIKSVAQLLELGANTNLQVTAMGNDYGNTALHALVTDLRAGEQSPAQLRILRMLLAHPPTDAAIYNGLGKTPYMSVSAKHQKLVRVLRPTVAWADIELVLEVNDNLDSLAPALAELVEKVSDLRLSDLLFCQHEGPEEELKRRRKMLWVGLLMPMTSQLCPVRKLSETERSVYKYCWSASQGPPVSIRQGPHNAQIALVVKSARESYREDMAHVLRETSAKFEEQARPLYKELLADEHGAILAAIPEKVVNVEPDEMNHGRFLITPGWAQQKDLSTAVEELCAVGVIQSEGDLGDLFQQGRHRLFGNESQKAVFADSDSLQFWMGLVAMWAIGVHEQYSASYDAKMRSFCKEGEFLAAPGLKGFSRIMAKAFEYKKEFDLQGFEQEVVSPLYVIDVLRCTYQLPNAERLFEVREVVTRVLPNARTKNGYSRKAAAPCGYRDMKLNVLWECGQFGSVVTEVQLMLDENARAKQKMHAVYQVMRGDFSTADIDSQVLAKKRTTLALALAPDMRTLQQEALRELSTGAMSAAVLLSYFDLGTTVAVGVQYILIGNTRDGYTTLGMLVGSLVIQALVTFSTGQGVLVAVVTLCGGKTMFDTYSVLANRQLSAEGSVNPVRALALTRMQELVLDALPQTFHQLSVLVQLEYAEQTYLLWFSLLFSGLSIGYVAVVFEFDIDTDLNYRKLFARVHGYIPSNSQMRKAIVGVGIMSLIMGFLAARMMAMAVLVVGDAEMLGIWIGAECLCFVFSRAAIESTFRYYQDGLDSVPVSLILNALTFLGALGVPFPFGRFPGMYGPTLYVPWVAATLTLNPVMLLFGLSLEGSSRIAFTEGELVWALGGATAVALAGAVMMAAAMDPSHRRSFLGRLSLKQYVAELWETRTYAPLGSGIDASRAHLLKFSRYYWPPNDQVRDWLEPNWDAWVVAPPQWFTPRFVKRIISAAPPEVLPLTVLRELADKYWEEPQKFGREKPESEAGGTTSANSMRMQGSIRRLGSQKSSMSSCRWGRQVEDTSREELVRMEVERRASKVFARAKQLWIWMVALAFSYVDLVTTVLVGLQYLDMGTAQGTSGAHVTFAMLGLSLGVQALFAHLSGQGALSTLVAVCGGKPLWDTYHTMFDKPTQGVLTAAAALTITRFMQVVMDSLPQAAAQTFLVAQLDSDDQSWAMVASIVGCIVSIAYLVATTELDADKSLGFRTNFPMVHGYIPSLSAVQEALVLLGILLFVGGILGAKLIALATLAGASAWVAVAWCSAEASALFVLRFFAEGRIWKFHFQGASGLMPTLLMHACIYLGMLAAPFPFLRFPGYCGPLPYSASIIYNLAINPAMVYSGFYLGGNRVVLDTQHVWMSLAIGSGVAVLGMVMMGGVMNAAHRQTFYKPRSLRTLIDTLWEERKLTYMGDETMAVGLDPSRANLIAGFTSDYWVSVNKLRAWLANWDAWEADQPVWFTMKKLDFQNTVVQYAPAEALPRTLLLKILAKAKDSEGNERAAPDATTDLLVAKVEAYRKDTSARERAGRFAKAVLAIRLYIVAIVISYVDLAGDVLVTLTLLQSEITKQNGYVTMGLTSFAQVVQAIISLAMGQGGVAAFAALVGAKPLLDTYNVLSKRPLTCGSKEDHQRAFIATRAEEVALQSLPQGFYQCLVLLQMAQAGDTSSWVQWVSVGGAALSVAFIVTDTDCGLDTGSTFRLDYPLIYGYTPADKRSAWWVLLGTFGFIGGTVVSKWVAIATLATASGSSAAVWLATECVVLLVLRQVVESSWRFHLHGLEAAVPSALVHLMFYIVSVAAPFPILRFPGYLGPSLYCASVCYQTIASPLMLLVAFSMEGGSGMPQADLWALVGVATVVLLVGASLMGCYMVPEYRKTFYQHNSFKMLIMWMWDERTRCVYGDGSDASRASVLGFAAWAWPPSDQVRTWLEGWERWEREQPAWFTEKWKARLRHPSVPPEALPPALRRKFDTANENKERYRRASSLIRSPSLAVSDGDAGGRSAGASAKVVPE